MANRNLLIGGASLGAVKLKNEGLAVIQLQNEFEKYLADNNFLGPAPFSTISLIFRYGDHQDWHPDIGEVDKKHNELPVAILFDALQLKQMSQEDLKAHLRLGLIECLCDVSANFDLPYEFLDDLR